jgi:hypothetical protein
VGRKVDDAEAWSDEHGDHVVCPGHGLIDFLMADVLITCQARCFFIDGCCDDAIHLAMHSQPRSGHQPFHGSGAIAFSTKGVILAEASLSFLGLGVPTGVPSWGVTISNGRGYLGDAWWISTFPGIALSMLVLTSGILGDALRDRFDPKLRSI